MKQTPELDKIQEKMRPGVLTLKGFLGSDDRKLADIVEADRIAFQNYEISLNEICKRLAELTEKGRDLMEQETLVEDRYLIKVRDDRGKVPSPWGDGLFKKDDVELFDKVTEKRIKWNSLTLKLLEAHGFWGGKGSEYRIEPSDIVKILDI